MNSCLIRRALSLVAIVAPTAAFVSPADAVTRYWIDPGGGSFVLTSNWSAISGGAGGASAPGVVDIAVFDLNNTYTVTFQGGSTVTNVNLDVVRGNVTFDLNNGTYVLTGGNGADIGNGLGTSRLTVTDGTLTGDSISDADNITLGNGDSAGYLTVTDGGRIGDGTSRMDLFVGNNGFGSLSLIDNGQAWGEDLIAGLNDSGTVSVSGPAAMVDLSSALAIGNGADATMSISSGATVSVAGTTTIGSIPSAEGTVTVSGANSSLNLSNFSTSIGLSGTGTLNINSGGRTTVTGPTILGSTSNSLGVINISGENSLWDSAGSLEIGNSGTGRLNISDGGRAVGGLQVVGDNSTGDGYVSVTTGGQWDADSGSIVIGDAGNGRLDINSGGEVTATTMTIGNFSTGTGVVNLSGPGSKLTTTAGSIGVGVFGDAELNVSDGAQLQILSSLTISDPAGTQVGRFNLDGGSVSIGASFNNSGQFSFTDGLLLVGGNFQPSTVSLPFTLDGLDNTDNPTLELIGAGLTTNVSAISVGVLHKGELNLRQGRVLNVSAGVSIAELPGSEGAVTLESGALLTTGTVIAVGGTSSTAGGKATLDIRTGSLADAGTLYLRPDATVNLDGGELRANTYNIDNGAQFNWTTGTVSVDNSTIIDDPFLQTVLGNNKVLRAGQTLANASAPQIMNLATPFTIDGGTLRGGVLNFQSPVTITSGMADALTEINNNSNVFLTNPLATLDGPAINNNGTISGTGSLMSPTTNAVTGTIESLAGDRLVIDNTLNNLGHVSVIDGELQVTDTLTNAASTGLISARNALLRFDNGVTNDGSIAFSNGTVDVYGDINQIIGGRITVTAGGIANFYDDVTIAPGAASVQVSAVGATTSAAVFFGSYNGGITGGGDAFIEGDHRPGNSPGLVQFTGNVSYGPFATLEVELAGTGSPGTAFDQVAVTKDLNLAGTLDVNTLGGFTPTIGDGFTIMTFAGSRNGVFDRVLFPSLSGVGLGVVYDASSVLLNANLIGDLNGDGFVGIDDLNIILGSWNQSVTAGVWALGDPTGDGFIGIDDLNAVLGNWNAGTPPTTTANIPEPGTLALLTVAGMGLVHRSRPV